VGYDLLAAVFVVAITPFVVVGFILFWVVNARDHEELAKLWRGYARSRSLDFIEPEGEWPNRTAPAMAWAGELARFRISAIGREARVRTRLTIRPRGALFGTLATAIDGGAESELSARERPAGFKDRLLTPRVRRLLLAFRQHDRLLVTYRRGQLTLEWPGAERNDARLDEARRVGEEIARAIDDEFRATASAAHLDRSSAVRAGS
jgi:hypothetical protein